jgi:hypothetical protein
MYVSVPAVAFGASIICGIMLLNMLPGEPVDPQDRHDDAYSFTTFGTWRIFDWVELFRWGFFAGFGGIIVFVASRMVQAPR